MIVILAGAPGSGKGTQADRLVAEAGFCKISTGDALRRQISLGSEIGRSVESYLNAGKLVPDEILSGVLAEELKHAAGRMILLDGYPRTLNQAKSLDEMKDEYPVSSVIHLDILSEKLIARLTGRRVCQDCAASYHTENMPPAVAGVCDHCGGKLFQRSDDNAEKIRTRLDVYKQETMPVLDFYKERGLYRRLDADKTPQELFTALRKMLEF